MSSTRRGEPTTGHHNGPYYSRYTERKIVFNFPSPDDGPLTSTPRYSTEHLQRRRDSLDSFQSARKGSIDSSFLSPRSPSSELLGSAVSEGSSVNYKFPLSRNNSSDSFSSRSSSNEFRALSPKFNLYNHPLSAFRSDSVESSTSKTLTLSKQGSFDQSAKDKRPTFSENKSFVNSSKPKGKFASILSKHSVTIFAAATLKVAYENITRKSQLASSCPELLSPIEQKLRDELKLRKKKNASYSDLKTVSHDNSGVRSHPAGNKLKVPDIFTTSFTHSSKSASSSCSSSPSKSTNKSTVSLQEQPDEILFDDNGRLRKTIRLTKATPSEQKVSSLMSTDMYKDEQIAQITNYLFIGSIESAFNERRLCRLEVESVVDISNVNAMQVPSDKKTQCPCLCQTEFRHFRSKLIIAVADEPNENIDQYFEEVNKFIEGARRCSKKVLIYSYHGKSRAVLFAIQYLISFEGLLLRQAFNLVKKQRPQILLIPSFQKTLEKLEKNTFPDEKHSVNICNEYLNVADPQAIKCAWIDC